MNAKKSLRRSLRVKIGINFHLIVLIFGIIIDLFMFAMFISESRLSVMYMSKSDRYKTVEYRGASLTYPIGLFPEEKLIVFYTVVDSLNDDVSPEYSIGNNPFRVYSNNYLLRTYLNRNIAGIASRLSNSIFLPPIAYRRIEEPHKYAFNNGDLAMILIHEYVHIVQFKYPELLTQYEKNVGWITPQNNRNENFYSVLSEYSLTKPSEDMAETFMYTYLCGNNLGSLSQERLNEALSFWSVPREEFCRNFN